MRTKIIHVTQRDIDDAAERYSGVSCPVARALHRQTNWPRASVLGDGFIYPRERVDDAQAFKAPASVANFVRRFDSGLPVKPFKFRIRIFK